MALRALGHQAPLVQAAPTVDIVMCYCAERLSWLRGLHQLPWRDEDRSGTMRAHVALRIYHKCGGFGAGVREAERQRLLADWGDHFHSVEVRFVDDAVRADDCS